MTEDEPSGDGPSAERSEMESPPVVPPNPELTEQAIYEVCAYLNRERIAECAHKSTFAAFMACYNDEFDDA